MNERDSQARNRRLLEIAAVVLILALGLWVRINDLADWNAHPNKAFYRGEPLLTTFDGYYYLTLARDLARDQYDRIDEKRAYPDHPVRPFPPPLLSVVAAATAELANVSLNWTGALLPAGLGVLLALPLYALGRLWGGPVMGGTSALLGLLSSFYVYRSSLGWFDTDCMIVTLTMGGIYFFHRFGVESKRTRYLHFLGGMITYGLFLWWWDQAVHVVTLISLFPLVLATLVYYRPPAKERLLFAVMLGAVFILLLDLLGWDLPLRIMRNVWALKHYIAKASLGDFPNVGVSISEQLTPPIQGIVIAACGTWPGFLAAAAGMALFGLRQPRDVLFLAVPIVLAGCSFFYASRFEIFLAPVVAMGIGYLVAGAWKNRYRWAGMKLVAPLLVIGAACPLLAADFGKTSWPKVHPKIAEGMALTRFKTPPDAVIWTTWSYGYPMIYWSERATINDGQAHSGRRTVYNYIPFATESPRLAANFIQFFSRQGSSGLQQFYAAVGDDSARGLALVKSILADGPQHGLQVMEQANLKPVGARRTATDWLSFFFPPDAPPTYLFLHATMPATSYWWYWLGSWDITNRSGTHPSRRIFRDVSLEEGRVTGSKGLEADLETGRVSHDGGEVSIKSATLDDGRQIREYLYEGGEDYHLHVFIPSGFAALQDKDLNDSVFSRLFYRRLAPSEYFRPIMVSGLAYQLWLVRGDRPEVTDAPQHEKTSR